jgi:hypothetical protein
MMCGTTLFCQVGIMLFLYCMELTHNMVCGAYCCSRIFFAVSGGKNSGAPHEVSVTIAALLRAVVMVTILIALHWYCHAGRIPITCSIALLWTRRILLPPCLKR